MAQYATILHTTALIFFCLPRSQSFKAVFKGWGVSEFKPPGIFKVSVTILHETVQKKFSAHFAHRLFRPLLLNLFHRHCLPSLF